VFGFTAMKDLELEESIASLTESRVVKIEGGQSKRKQGRRENKHFLTAL
jgi:hypothetical protein